MYAKSAELEVNKLLLAGEDMEQSQEARKVERDYAKDDHDATTLLDLKKKKLKPDMLAWVFSPLRPHFEKRAHNGQ